MASPTSSVGGSACLARCGAWLEGFYKMPGVLGHPPRSPASPLEASKSLLLPPPNLPSHGMHALAARKGGREVVETLGLHPAERPGVQQFAWEVGGGSRLERDISQSCGRSGRLVIEIESVY